jgi:hypothetical protein
VRRDLQDGLSEAKPIVAIATRDGFRKGSTHPTGYPESHKVVPAYAGTHTPRPRVFCTVANGFCSNKLQWLWVPAFAGTTQEVRVLQIRISNSVGHKHSFAISPRIHASLSGTFGPLKSEGAGNAGRPPRPQPRV